MADKTSFSTSLSIDSLSKRFAKHLLTINTNIEPANCQALWQDVALRYSEDTRTYHGLDHLKQLFRQFDQIKHNLQQPHIIALALFYHDVIYDPTRIDNEQQSADYAVKQLNGYLSAEQCQRIYALIMMTVAHKLEDTAISDSDASYLLDMDLSILGTAWDDYQCYAQAVRQEYTHVVATDDYRSGRVAVLEGLLAHPRLYLTEDYHDRLERNARQNISREIKSLHSS